MILLIISKAFGKMIHEKNLKQKILWHCPFKAKHQRTQECTGVTSQNFIKVVKILSLETIPLKSRVKEIYKNLFIKIEYSQNQLSHLSKASSPK
jgi:hypothetical protein